MRTDKQRQTKKRPKLFYCTDRKETDQQKIYTDIE